MRTHLSATLLATLGLAVALVAAAPAGAVQVAVGSGSGIAGQTVDIAISTASLTGLNVQSFQFELTYNPTVITATDVLETGTLVGTAGWGDATFNVTSAGGIGRISVSHAGTVALNGAGTLLTLRFLINPAQLTPSASSLTFTTFTFNEGTPNDTTSNNTLNISATPVIAVSPNTGEVVRAQTLPFSVSGTVTNPVTWGTTNASIATISGAGVLTGQAPGSVRVFAVDNAGRRDTTDGEILIRGMGLTVGNGSAVVGQDVTIAISVTPLNGLGIRAGQVTLAFNGSYLQATGVTTPPGSMLNGYGPVGFGSAPGGCTVDFAGSTDLTGSGVLCYITFHTLLAASVGVSAPVALFNETLPAKVTGGTVSIAAIPTITVAPDNITLLAGQTQQFTLSGSPTAPVTWSTLDPLIASISTGGLLTALSGGVTRVRAVDNVGATDENTSVTVYDFAASLPTISVPPGATVRMPILVDRDLGALNLRSLQYRVLYNGTQVLQARATPAGLVSVWGPSGLVTNPQSGVLVVAAAGANPVPSGPGRELQVLEFDLAPSVPINTNIPITLSGFTCNEGLPSARITNGVIQVRTTADAGEPEKLSFAMGPATPNPSPGACAVHFTLPVAAGRVRLEVYAVDGRRVRTLIDGPLAAGGHDARWDGRDQSGAAAAVGLYLFKLESGGRTLSSKFARLR